MEDPVEHLRAAALSTLKSKRRKPAVERLVPIPARHPPPTESFQLDYGLSDDNVKSEEHESSVFQQNKSYLIPPEQKSLDAGFNDEGHSREEGEISDEEEEQYNVAQQILPSSQSPESSIAHGSNSSQKKGYTGQAPLQLALDNEFSTPTHNPTLLRRLSQPPASSGQMKQGTSTMYIESVPIIIDSEHVRPGLSLTQEEFDTIKDVVLDLLGWGVDPSYLLECGVNRSLLFYVFNELNLRLPDNFDMSGITVYAPDTSLHEQGEFLIPPGVILRHDHQDYDLSEQTKPSTAGPIPNTILRTTESDLSDMERSRRQELLARKAVQASRKLHRPDTRHKTNNLIDNTIPTTSDTVDDFLRSFGPVPTSNSPIDQKPLTLPDTAGKGDEMDVDKASEKTESIKSHKSDDSLSALPPASTGLAPPTSGSSVSTTFSTLSATASTPKPDAPLSVKVPIRRATKRPVASDFVDFDSSSRRQEPPSSRFGGYSQNVINPRRSFTAGFHNIGLSRRCVIDLSDSEDEDGLHPSPQFAEENVHQRKELNKLGKQVSVSFKPSDSMSPSILAEKENQIRMMRELIAKREEETRLRKLALAKSQSNSVTRASSAMPDSDIIMKQEELDVAIAAAVQLSNDAQVNKSPRDSESATPEPNSISSSPRASEAPADAIPADRSEALTASNGRERCSVEPAIVKSSPDLQAVDEKQIDMQTTLLNAPPAKNVVDADTSPLSSTQTESTTLPSGPPKQDVKKLHTSSATSEISQQHVPSSFLSYCSPFDLYPRLREQSQSQSIFSSSHSISDFMHNSSSSLFPSTRSTTKPSSPIPLFFSITGFPLPDLKDLRLISAIKSTDPSRRICHYEIPGGGTCRDAGCEDIHLSRLQGSGAEGMTEPNLDDTAQYLFSALPPSWLNQHHISSPSVIHATLNQNKTKSSTLEECCALALISLVSTPTV